MVAEVLATIRIGYPVLMIGLHDEYDQKWKAQRLNEALLFRYK